MEVIHVGNVKIRVHRVGQAAAGGPALLWIHGGGYVLGSNGLDDALCARFAKTLGILVAEVDYRLAPEHPYPASAEDCYTALRWLAQSPEVDPNRIAVGGASAGGGLAAALALMARDRGEISPVLQLLVYPMLDDRSPPRTGRDERPYRLWNSRSNRFGWTAYLGTADPAVAVPARRADLAGLPAAWIGVGSHDLFRDEDLAYADQLTAAGVVCETVVVPGVFHGFDVVAVHTPVARAFFADQCRALRAAFRDWPSPDGGSAGADRVDLTEGEQERDQQPRQA